MYLTTIPAPLFFSIIDYFNFSPQNQIILSPSLLMHYLAYFYDNEDMVYRYIREITQSDRIDPDIYRKHINRIMEIPDITMIETSQYLYSNIEDMSRFMQVLQQTINNSHAVGNPTRPIIDEDDIRNYQTEPNYLLDANPLDLDDDSYTLGDTPILPPVYPKNQLGGSSIVNTPPSIESIEKLIVSIHEIIKRIFNPDGMVVKSILEDPFELTDGFFSGKKIVLDWIGLVMAYITFIIGNSEINDGNITMMDNVNFIPHITYDNPDGSQFKYCYDSEILTCDNCILNPPSGFCTAPFSQFMSLITLALTLEHTEGIRQTTARTSYVMLRTSPYYIPSSESKILSIFSYKERTRKALSEYNISYEVFRSYIDILTSIVSPISDCINTFVKLRYKIVTLLTDADPTLLQSTTSDDPYPRLVKNYRLTLYNPTVNGEEAKNISNIYIKIAADQQINNGEYNNLSEIIMYQPDIIGGSNSRPASDNWVSNANTTYNDIIYQSYQIFLLFFPYLLY